MSHARPGYSEPFAPQSLQEVAPLHPIEDISPEWAWGSGENRGSEGRGVKVAVIDSGIDATHPAIAGGVSGYVAVVKRGDEVIFETTPHGDDYGHGTACAGIIRSLAPACELYSVRVLGPGSAGLGAMFQAGLRWAVDNGMDVCNLSLSTPKKEFYGALHELADAAYFRNILLVAAANNLPRPSFPAVYASVVAVASHAVPDPFCIYYNPRPPVEFGAHGINVRVAWREGSWISATGNSFAAPHISGLAARILSKHPGLTVFQMKVILRALAANVTK